MHRNRQEGMTGAYSRSTTTSASSSTVSTSPSSAPPTSQLPSPVPSKAPLSSAPKNAMAASPFLAQPPSFLTSATSQSPFASMDSAAGGYPSISDISAVGPHPFSRIFPSGYTSVKIRRLPINIAEDSIRLMLAFSGKLVSAAVLPPEVSQDAGYCTAIATFESLAAAEEIKSKLDGKPNISDVDLVVEILDNGSSATSRRLPIDAAISGPPSMALPTVPTPNPSRQPSRFNGTSYGSRDHMPPSINGGFTGSDLANYGSNDLPTLEPSPNHLGQLRPSQSPIGNHLNQRMSGKTLIKTDDGDDDETGALLRDPVAYAENGAMGAPGRRATAPQIPADLSRSLAGLSLNTNGHAVGPYGGAVALGPLSAHGTAVGAHGTAMGPLGNTRSPPQGSTISPTRHFVPNHFMRHTMPQINPADQNPPCNTLYVGNLPTDTSEEELKSVFSKQRGYKRLCFRTKHNGPMCFVEFEDVSFAAMALTELYGHPLHNSVRGGLRLSFSKNPLGVRSNQNPAQAGGVGMGGGPGAANGLGPLAANGMMAGAGGSFTPTTAPPPGLPVPPPPGLNVPPFRSAPPGIGPGAYAPNSSMTNVGAIAPYAPHFVPPLSQARNGSGAPFSSHSNPWGPTFGSTSTTQGEPNGSANGIGGSINGLGHPSDGSVNGAIGTVNGVPHTRTTANLYH